MFAFETVAAASGSFLVTSVNSSRVRKPIICSFVESCLTETSSCNDSVTGIRSESNINKISES